MIAPLTSCDQAREFLRKGDTEGVSRILDHLTDCPSCEEYFNANEEQFSALFEKDPLDSLKDAASQAIQRLSKSEFRLPSSQEEDWEAPTIPGYDLERMIGQTRFSKVFIARQLTLDRQVALKCVRTRIPKPDLGSITEESLVLAGLHHPNILTIHETGTWDNGLWLALEYCQSGSLATRLKKTWAPREAARLIRDISLAAHLAHKKGIIHRDIKPANILFTKEGQPKLGDFGLANGSYSDSPGTPSELVVMGTPAYIAPEQLKSQPLDARTDVHALGAVLYHLLAARPPYTGENSYESLLLAAHAAPPPLAKVNPQVPDDLAAICLKCLEKDRDNRYPTAKELAKDLQHFLDGEEVQARPLGQFEQLTRWIRRNKTAAFVAFSTLFLLILTTTGLAVLSVWAVNQRQRAEAGEAQAHQSQAIALMEREIALAQARKAGENQQFAELQSYINKIQRASFEWEQGLAPETMDLLESTPFIYRGWEHDHLTTLLRKGQVTFAGHAQEVESVVVAPNGSYFVSSGEDGLVLLWDPLGRAGPIRLAKLEEPARGLALAREKDILAVASKGRKVYFYDTKSRLHLGTLEINPNNNRDFSRFGENIALSPDGSTLYCEKDGSGLVALDRREVKPARDFGGWKGDALRCLVLSPDGKKVAAAGGNGFIGLWDTQTGELLHQLPGGSATVRGLAFSPDGKTLVAAREDDRASLFNTATGKLIRTLEGHTDSVVAVAVSPDGQRVATGADDYTIRIWSMESGALLQTLKGHTNSIRTLAFFPEGRRLLSGAWDRTIKVWDTLEGPDQTRIKYPDIPRSLDFSPNGSLLVAGGNDRTAHFWSLPRPREKMALASGPYRVQALGFDPTGKRLATGYTRGPQSIRIWDSTTGNLLRGINSPSESMQSLCFSPNGKHLYTLSDDGNLMVWNPETGLLQKLFHAHDRPGLGVAAHPDGKVIATAGGDKLVRIWSTADWAEVTALHQHTTMVRSVAFSPNGKLLASGSEAGQIRIWEVETWKNILILPAHKEAVTRLHFSPDSKRLVSSSFDKTVKLWDPASGQEMLTLQRFPSSSRAAVFSPDGRTIAAAGDSGTVVLFEATARLESQTLEGRFGPLREAGFLPGTSNLVVARDQLGNSYFWETDSGRETEPPTGMVPYLQAGQIQRVSRSGQWLLELRGNTPVLVDQNLRKAREEEDQRRLREWGKPQGIQKLPIE